MRKKFKSSWASLERTVVPRKLLQAVDSSSILLFAKAGSLYCGTGVTERYASPSKAPKVGDPSSRDKVGVTGGSQQRTVAGGSGSTFPKAVLLYCIASLL